VVRPERVVGDLVASQRFRPEIVRGKGVVVEEGRLEDCPEEGVGGGDVVASQLAVLDVAQSARCSRCRATADRPH
jgi:hypothetical protein